MTVSPTSVPASSTSTLAFTYTPVAGRSVAEVRLDVPDGWTAPAQEPPPASATDPGAVSVTCPDALACRVLSVKGRQITVVATGGHGTEPKFTIFYSNATAPGSATTSTFAASELSGSNEQFMPLGSSPQVAVTCADGTGVMMVLPNMVNAASVSTLTFTYTAAGVCGVEGGAVSLDVPPGWTPPSPTPGAQGYATSSLGSQSVFVSGMRITVSGVTLARGQTLTISYNHGTAPGSATTSTFGASEQSTSTGTLIPLEASPPVSVTVAPPTSDPTSPPTAGPSSPPTDAPTGPAGPSVEPTTSVGSAPSADTGTMTVSPDTVTASRPGTVTFTYRAPASGLASAGAVTLEVPPGWTTPSREPGAAGYTTSSPGELSVSGRRITVTGAILSPGQPLAIIYRPTAAPQAAGPSVFAASERPAAASLLTALASSPSVTVAGPPGFHIPLQLALVLLAAGCVAAVSAIRFLRHRRLQPALTPSVQAVQHAGPPGTVSVQHTGTGVTHTVGIEPYPAAVVTTIEETRP